MSLIDMGVKNLKALGFGAALPTERDQLLNMVTGDANKDQDEKIKALEAQTKAQGGMKKGGKVSSASKRADGCAVKGKTKGRLV
jgi:hypothetical protein